uniref:G-protein coupled receptors family 1 profile domain-containing protein n=1 Tax=Sparus aurata TaxID=8175 RepID=A0A671VBW3_SPAAU
MENITAATPLRQPIVFELEGFYVPPGYSSVLFVLALLNYIVTLLGNGVVACVIVIDKTLHRPMFIMLCNLVACDLLGATAVLPRLMMHFLTGQKKIAYGAALAQAFSVHMYGVAVQTILGAMAYDRYVAICNPLRYAAIMTNKMVIKLTVSAWGVAIILVGILLGLTIRLNRCRTMIMNPYCDNASLFKLSCDSVFINNVYGLTFTVVLLTSSIGTMVLTYTKITVVCLTSKNKSLNSKALKTCSTHLVVYLIMLISEFIVITLHRFPQYSDYRKLAAILFVIVPGSLNPIIYGSLSRGNNTCSQKVVGTFFQ